MALDTNYLPWEKVKKEKRTVIFSTNLLIHRLILTAGVKKQGWKYTCNFWSTECKQTGWHWNLFLNNTFRWLSTATQTDWLLIESWNNEATPMSVMWPCGEERIVALARLHQKELSALPRSFLYPLALLRPTNPLVCGMKWNFFTLNSETGEFKQSCVRATPRQGDAGAGDGEDGVTRAFSCGLLRRF